MLPQITQLEFETEEIVEDLPKMGKSFLYDFNKGDFVLRNGRPVVVEGLEALKVWIVKAIKTERYRFKIYEGEEYGTTIEDLIGTNYPRTFVEAEIKREVTSSLLNHPLIDAVQEWEFIRERKWMLIKCRVVSPLGTFDQEVRI